MKAMVALGLVVALASLSVSAGESAFIGAALADIYDAFAPLSTFYHSYADFLFYGTDVVMSEELGSACERTGTLSGLLQIHLMEQTGSHVLEVVSRLTRLRVDLATFCDGHFDLLASISRTDEPDPSALGIASEAGLFSDIYELQQGLRFTLESALDSMRDDVARWEFAVAFALKTLLGQRESLPRIEGDLEAILYGSEEAIHPPAFVPEEISAAIVQLVQYTGVPLDASMVNEVRALAQLIFNHVLGES